MPSLPRSPSTSGTPRGRSARLRAFLLGLAALGGIVAIILAGRAWRTGGASRPVRREAGLSVLLVTIDTLRADAVGAYGNPGQATPWMDRLAAGGVRFDQAHAQNVMTLPSHANILTGRHPFEHGVRDNAGFRMPRGLDTLASLLRARGYRTGAFVSAFPLDARFGLDRGFEVYDDRFLNVDTSQAFFIQDRPGRQTVGRALEWLASTRPGPWLCWVHLYEPHFPYRPPEPFASRFRDDPYLGEVAAADAALGPLLAPILEAGADGRTLVVLTSDHGESRGEHGEMTHGILAYEATLRVPLVLFAPRLFAPRVVGESVRHVDLVPTIMDALAAPVPRGLPGRSLLALAHGGSGPAPPSYFEALSGRITRGWAPLYGVIQDGMKFVDLPIPELYDLLNDPKEARNLAAERPERVAALRALLERLRGPDTGGSPPAPESAETRERLQSLGYLAGVPAPARGRFTEEDDPKRLMILDGQMQEVLRRHQAGDVAGAIALAQEVVRARPDMPVALVDLGALYREAGDLDQAIATLRRALTLAPTDAATAALLGAYLSEAGRAREAVVLLEPAARREDPDVDVLVALGMALAQTGRRAEALAAFERARRADPSNAMVLVDVATVHMMAGDDARAHVALEGALALNPDVARAYNALGVIAARHGRPDEAIERWQRAVELDPRDADTLFNLGTMLLKRGRSAQARESFERFVRAASPALYAKDLARVREWLALHPPAP